MLAASNFIEKVIWRKFFRGNCSKVFVTAICRTHLVHNFFLYDWDSLKTIINYKCEIFGKNPNHNRVILTLS